MATQYFAERGIVCISRIDITTLCLLATATATAIQHSILFLNSKTSQGDNFSRCGTCNLYELQMYGAQGYHVFSGCNGVATLVLRGGATVLLEEVIPIYYLF